MSRFSGKQYRGAKRDARAVKRTEANARNKVCPELRRKRFRYLLDNPATGNTK